MPVPTRPFPNPNGYPDWCYYDNMFSATLIDNGDGTFTQRTTGGGGGDATAANQVTQIGLATSTDTNISAINANISTMTSNSNTQATTYTGQILQKTGALAVGASTTIPPNSIVLFAMRKTAAGTFSRMVDWQQFAQSSGGRSASDFEYLENFATLNLGNMWSSDGMSDYFLNKEFTANSLQMVLKNTSVSDTHYYWYITQI